jgi:hypothetical protein
VQWHLHPRKMTAIWGVAKSTLLTVSRDASEGCEPISNLIRLTQDEPNMRVIRLNV